MTEMTVGEAIFALHKNGVILSNSIKRQIAALIEQQAAEIAKKDSLICKLKTCRTCNFVMADRCDKHDRLIDNPMREKCDDWQWLEKEAQGVE